MSTDIITIVLLLLFAVIANAYEPINNGDNE